MATRLREQALRAADRPSAPRQHPLRTATIVFGLMFGAMFLAGAVAQRLRLGNAGTVWLVEAVLASLVAILLTRYRWWHTVGLLALPRSADVRLLVVPALLALFPLTDGFTDSLGVEDLVAMGGLVLLVSFAERRTSVDFCWRLFWHAARSRRSSDPACASEWRTR
jgi:hypothetical protein